MNKKGFTIIEFALGFVLLSVVVILLFQIIIVVKELYVSALVKTKLLTKQSVIVETFYEKLFGKDIVVIYKNSDDSVTFIFEDGFNKTFEYDRDEKTIKYDDFSTKLIDGSYFGNINLTTETILNVDSTMNNSLLKIKIPIYHPLLPEEDFGINMIYQYNNKTTSVSSLDIIDNLDSEKKIYLTGSADMITFTNIDFEDPGYYVLEQGGGITYNDPSVVVTGSVGNNPNTTYTLTYTIYDSGGIVVDRRTRNVQLLNSFYNFEYKGNTQSFSVPVSGQYQLDVWGAEGGSANLSNDRGGKGGYTSGSYYFVKGEILYVEVGGKGGYTATGSIVGGYNGGGTSGAGTISSGSSGGGSTDIRTSLSLSGRMIIAGGGGGSGSRNDSSYQGAGGSGGGLIGGSPTYLGYASYNGSPGTSEFGGAPATYDTGITSNPTPGTLGAGGNGGTYNSTYGGGAGGGGYHGGGGGVRFGGGGGGSGYCGYIASCTSKSGIENFTLPDGNNANGNSGDGYARISLISIVG